MDILRRAYERETDSRDRRPPHLRSWEYYTIGASQKDVRRLLDEGLLIVAIKTSNITKYKLSDKGRELVWALSMEREFAKIPAESVLDAMGLVVGFDDVKEAIAWAVATRRRTNFLLEGPPACAKSLILERGALSGTRCVYRLRLPHFGGGPFRRSFRVPTLGTPDG